MPKSSAWRLTLLSLAPLLSFLGLAVVCLSGPEPQQKQKIPSFPHSLWAQATSEDYIDERACVDCHRTAHEGFERSPHASYVSNARDPQEKRGCQSCHGPGGPHVAHLEEAEHITKYILSYTKSKPLESALGCLRCHNDTMTLTHWRRTGHAQGNVSCADCHQIHQASEAEKSAAKVIGRARNGRAPVFPAAAEPRKMLKSDEASLCGKCHRREANEFRQNFHHPVPEGRQVCSDCHEIHPRRGAEKQTAAHTRSRSVRETCASCHAETAGPFVFEHEIGTEGCTECHRPHGSHNPKLLTTFSRGVCSQCHTEKANNHFPGRTCWQSGCHVAVHGSNSDRFLLRR